jgi:hypothetical protein
MDVGMGYGNIGKYAKDIFPEIELNGVEIFLPYLFSEASQAKHYKRIVVGDIRELIGKLWPVDIVTAWDVIEHLDREDGVNVISYLKSIANTCLLVSVPIIDYPQGALVTKIRGVDHKNDAEMHRTQWKVEEMEALGAITRFKGQVTGLFEFRK